MSGKLFYNGKQIYTFTQEDRDVLVRSVFGEEGADACSTRAGLAVAVTMINRWAMFLTLPWYQKLLLKQPAATVYGYGSLADLVHAYSQPVNGAWLDGGKFDKNPGMVDPQEHRRLDILTRPIESFPFQIRNMVDWVLATEGVPLPAEHTEVSLSFGVPKDMAGLVHFYCPAIYYARKLKKPFSQLTPEEIRFACMTAFGSGNDGKIFYQPAGVKLTGNAYYKVARTLSWKPYTICVKP